MERLPKEIITDIILVMSEVEKNVHAITHPTNDFQLRILKYLFEVYNKYISYSDKQQDISCSGCRSLVVGKFRNFANQWKIQQETSKK